VAPKAATKTDSRLAARLAAIASLGAAVIHFAVVPTHWQEWMPSGLFFVLIALFQLIWAQMVLARTTTPVLTAGIMVNVGAVALWAVSRTAGAPFGPHAGEPELVQAADLCALLLQIYVVMGAGWAWYRGHQGEPIPAFANAIVLLGAGAVIALASTVGVASGLRHGHHAPGGAEPEHHGPSIEHEDGHHGHPEPATSPPIIESIGPPDAPAPIEAPPPAVEPLHDATDGDHHHDE
jgi:lipoprotein signal peptidase